MDPFPPITHVAVTVSDLERSVPWYRALFAAEPVLDEDTGPFRHVVFAVGGTLFGLHQFPDPRPGTFDERRAGLDHVAFGVGARGELEKWAARLDELDVVHGEHQGRRLRLGPVVPRPGRHRARAVRPARRERGVRFVHPDTLLELARATHRERLEAARALGVGRGRRAGRPRWLRKPVPSPGGGGPS